MRRLKSVTALDDLGRVRLSQNFWMREFLYSEVANFHGIPNLPEDPDLAIAAGRKLCEELLEPLFATFGKIWVRSGYRSPAVNGFCNDRQREGKAGYPCASNDRSRANHIWDLRDEGGHMGACATIVIPWFADRHDARDEWRRLAWYVHDHLPYHELLFFPKLAAFNIGWHERPLRRIDSYIAPRGTLTKPGMANHAGRHDDWYPGFPRFVTVAAEVSARPPTGSDA
ncbi:hypothetical protein [Maritimibacter sp. DP1N21-5]|uniref:hypothetical protein n=1 Tax=Maritimibacter sp. DP1N21-5 TaxID=2836867 RepID=UPI001C477462|nr:hypothetical protein [Maritimibacter sp. DP1N21-5]MBV7410306.1 hypothetical protein [Maritimibacter sp. DP1N21-5]